MEKLTPMFTLLTKEESLFGAKCETKRIFCLAIVFTVLFSPLLWRGAGGEAFAQFSQMQKIVASDRAASDDFGYSVSISGIYAIVGAWFEKEDALGGNTMKKAGSAYIYEFNGTSWVQVQKLVASDRAADDNFGFSVSIFGNYVIVGAPSEAEDATGGNTMGYAGSAYIFERVAGVWTEVKKIVASDRAADDRFGSSVSISGTYAIVGAGNEDEDASGGNTLNNSGAAYIFGRTTGTWVEMQKIVASDRAEGDQFGYVSLSGAYAIVGAHYEDEDAIGGNTLNNSGSAYIYEFNGTSWVQVQKLVASDRAASDEFGYSVSLSGNYAIAGSPYEDQAGSAYLFERINGNWTQVKKMVASDRSAGVEFGNSVSLSGDYAVVGAPYETRDASGGNFMLDAGAVYLFERDGSGNWQQEQKMVASDRVAGDHFSHYSVSISGSYIIAGAHTEDEDASGGNTLVAAGSAYIYSTPGMTIILTLTNSNCSGACTGSATATPSGGKSPYTYIWNTIPAQTTATATNLCAGTYTVIVTDDGGNTKTTTVAITQPPRASITVGASATNITSGENTQLFVTGAGTYLWSPAAGLSCITCANPTATPLATTDYCVLVTDGNNCTDSACITINITPPCGNLFVPTAFSPNHDGINDIVYVKSDCIKELDFKIYDRWGNKVFESAKATDGWDGKYNGKAMDAAVFVYYVNATLFSGKIIAKKGNVTLIR